jgi:hypothetical protein
MRKCQMCGYLVLGDGEICKHCGALLPRASLLVTSGAPPAASVTHAPQPAPPASPPPPSFGSPPPMDREYWNPPAAPLPQKPARSTPRVALVFIVVASMALGWVAVGRFFNDDKVPAGTSDFVAGNGVAYSSPDNTFTAEFPSQPVLKRQTIPVGSSSATMNLAQAQTDKYEVVAASMVLPIRIPEGQVDAALHEILDAGAQSQGAKIESEKPVTVNGATGIEVRAKVQDGYDARMLVVVSGSRVFFLGTHAVYGNDRLYDALLSSLVIF